MQLLKRRSKSYQDPVLWAWLENFSPSRSDIFLWAAVKAPTVDLLRMDTLTDTKGTFLRTFAQKFSKIGFFLKILPLKDDEVMMSEM